MMVPTTPRQLLHSTYEHPTITVTVRLRVNDAHSIFVRVYTEIGPASQSLLVILAYVLYRNCTYCITFIHGSRTNEWVHSQCSIYLYLYLYDVQMLIATSHPRMALMSHTVMSIQFSLGSIRAHSKPSRWLKPTSCTYQIYIRACTAFGSIFYRFSWLQNASFYATREVSQIWWSRMLGFNNREEPNRG